MSQDKKMTHYVSGRAECPHDVNVFRGLMKDFGQEHTFLEERLFFDGSPPQWSGEMAVELYFPEQVDYNRILDVVRQIEDGHVLLQTLEPTPKLNNICERDYDRR